VWARVAAHRARGRSRARLAGRNAPTPQRVGARRRSPRTWAQLCSPGGKNCAHPGAGWAVRPAAARRGAPSRGRCPA
jgi:hypothetical protein